jgi:hypothetical protein
MPDINYLNLLYFTLTIFLVVIWTLLSLVLVRVLRILKTVEMISNYVNDTVEKVVLILWIYKKIPEIIKDNLKNFFKRKK